MSELGVNRVTLIAHRSLPLFHYNAPNSSANMMPAIVLLFPDEVMGAN